MLRRQPTTIKLTPEDVLSYDDEKLTVSSTSGRAGANQNVSCEPQEADPKSKQERIGLVARRS
ncbi:CDC26 family anaphase-promoting complex subunit CYBJADRAFT_166929 [Cyberlindnera jadinii NRRL Y-1542]|uniref:Uncharacterized protein n=1 Tax=Cyberlindnera jadinii (strain ATCC 18201 / CBS 1600 / BCRC 20928 / JCM 3617 / NBRC 0987 / NRRL Y-1542) TaxID=983966 RepID=A0A1E4S412_CYBJN|nr:hypothetical protein CYBJADRAFT_166929 [Cyberlindnera jadinii NRRL Y-1542]ODV74225.1 hypothetical protein CYBJADRAFT_166929 [Cyberlindnera jadinii NRRL Y-1542]